VSPARASRRVRARRRATAGLVALLVAAGAYVPLVLVAPLAAAQPVAADWAAPALDAPELVLPGFGASAVGAVGWEDAQPDGVLASAGTAEPVPIASISKVVTALVVLEARPLAADEQGPEIVFTPADAALWTEYVRQGGKVLPSPAGLVLTERQLLETVLVESANNHADTLATWAYGSRQAFVDAVAGWLSAHGLESTTLVEPTGMSPLNRSTPTDLVALGELALAHPVVAEIVGTAAVTVPGVGDLENSNGLLGHDGVDGIKTGTLNEAGYCLLFSTDVEVGEESITVVGVVLGATDRETLLASADALLEEVGDGFHEVELASEGDVFGTYATVWGAEASAVAAADASVVVWRDTPITSTRRLDPVPALVGGPAPDAVGEAVFRAGDREIAVPLLLDAPLDAPDAWWRMTHPLDLLEM